MENKKNQNGILDEKIQSKIDKLTDVAYEYIETGNAEKSFSTMYEAWSLYPDPKENWVEAYNTAKYIFQNCIKLQMPVEAKKWLNEMIKNNNHWRNSDAEVAFETGELEEAYKMFCEAVKQSGGKNHYRYFEGEDKKYLAFYKKERKTLEKIKKYEYNRFSHKYRSRTD